MSLNKAFYYILVVAICVLLIVLPQINSTVFANSTISSKFIVFAYSSLGLTGGFFAMRIFSKPKAFQISKLDIGLFLLVSYIIINRYFIQSEYGFSIRFFELIGLSALYIILRNLSIKASVWFLFSVVISGSIQAVYGNLQLLGYYPSNHSGFKLTGSFFNPGPYAGFLTIVYAVSLGMYLNKEYFIQFLNIEHKNKNISKITKYVLENVLLLALISIILVIPATQSRAAWVGVLLSSIVLLEYRYQFIKSTLRKVTGIKRAIASVLTIGILCIGIFGAYQLKKGSADGRLFIWKVTSEIVKDSPITGVGFDRFKANYMNYQANYFAKHGETAEALVADNTYYAFNDWLQFFAEQGVVGLILLLLMIYVFLNIKTTSKQFIFKSLVLGVLVAASAFASFSYPMQILPFKLVALVLLSLLALLDANKYTISIKRQHVAHVFSKSVISVAVILFLVISVPFTQKVSMAYKDWKTALNIYQYGDYESAINYYKKAYPMLKKDGDFLMNFGKALVMYKQNEDAVKVLEQAKQHLNTTIIETALGDAYKGIKIYDKAEIAYQHAANMIPVRFYPEYLLAKLYEESGQKDKAISMAKTILNKDIKIPSTAIREMRAEMKDMIKKPLGLKN